MKNLYWKGDRRIVGIQRPERVSSFNTSESSEYCARIKTHKCELLWYLPLPSRLFDRYSVFFIDFIDPLTMGDQAQY